MKGNLCVFGGSFDPPTKAHLNIIKILSKKFDTVLVVVNLCNYYRKNFFMFTFEARQKLLIDACEKLKLKNVIVSDIEKDLQSQHTFIDTIKLINEKYGNDYVIYSAIGGDSYNNFKTWKDWQSILNYTRLIVLPRTNEKYQPDFEVPHILCKSKIKDDGSATTYREKLYKKIVRNTH